MSKTPLIIFTLLTVAFNARAQNAAHQGDTVLKGATIEVIQSYKPQVKQAQKPDWVPQLPPVDTAHPAFKYEVPQQTLYFTYSSLPLRPLALGIDSAILPFQNYVKAGAGNLSTIYLDAGIGSLCGPGYETAIHLHHISQQGDIKYQQTALSGIEAEGILHKQDNDWHATINAERDQYNYYANPVYEPTNNIEQTYTTISAAADMQNKDSINSRLSYHPAISATDYIARFNTTETTIGINAPVTYNIDTEIQLQAALKGALTHFNYGTGGFNNNYLELLPGINFHEDIYSGHAYLGLAVGKGGSGYVLPDFLVAAPVPILNNSFIASAGWLATLRQNTYKQLTTENPYLDHYFYGAIQTRKDEVFVNLQSSLGQHLSFSGRLSWNSWNELPTYLSLKTAGIARPDNNQFSVDYQQVKAISLQLATRYQVANIWSVGATADFYDFYQHTQEYVWEQPDVKIKGDFMIRPIPKLTVTAYLALLGGIYANNEFNEAIKLKTYTDLGGNGEYQFSPRLSAFVQVSNLLNNKYQRWLGYEAYGLNIYGGLRLKF